MRTVAVIGAGQMGSGISQQVAQCGMKVLLSDIDLALAEKAKANIDKGLARLVARDKLTPDEAEAALARIAPVGDYARFEEADLIIEAATEREEIKRKIFEAAGKVLRDDAIMASNTSSIPITRMANSSPDPKRFIGLHFFNPVPASQLVEIVVGTKTDPVLADRARDWVEALGKTPVTVHDAPGFASSRLGVAIGLEAIRMLEDGVASAEDIDLAMTLGYKHPVGPLHLTDLVGLDVRLGIAEYLHSELGERFAPPALLRQLVAEGKLGRKTGQGFFTWEES